MKRIPRLALFRITTLFLVGLFAMPAQPALAFSSFDVARRGMEGVEHTGSFLRDTTYDFVDVTFLGAASLVETGADIFSGIRSVTYSFVDTTIEGLGFIGSSVSGIGYASQDVVRDTGAAMLGGVRGARDDIARSVSPVFESAPDAALASVERSAPTSFFDTAKNSIGFFYAAFSEETQRATALAAASGMGAFDHLVAGFGSVLSSINDAQHLTLRTGYGFGQTIGQGFLALGTYPEEIWYQSASIARDNPILDGMRVAFQESDSEAYRAVVKKNEPRRRADITPDLVQKTLGVGEPDSVLAPSAASAPVAAPLDALVRSLSGRAPPLRLMANAGSALDSWWGTITGGVDKAIAVVVDFFSSDDTILVETPEPVVPTVSVLPPASPVVTTFAPAQASTNIYTTNQYLTSSGGGVSAYDLALAIDGLRNELDPRIDLAMLRPRAGDSPSSRRNGSNDDIDLSAYLPLVGGTLTGALGGTDASFSGDLSATTLSVVGSTTLNSVEYLFPGADGASDAVLTTDGAGGLSWSTLSAGSGTVTGGAAGRLAFYPTTSTTVDDATGLFYDSGTGRLGIGTTTPQQTLSVEGSFDATGTTTLATTTITGSLTVNGSTYITQEGLLSVGDKVITPGDIGLGTSTPAAKLAIQSTLADQTAFIIVGTSSQTSPLFDVFDNQISYTNILRITAGGDIGIGTTTPYAKLTVGGDIALTGGLYDNTGTRGSSGQILQSTGTGLAWVTASSSANTSLSNLSSVAINTALLPGTDGTLDFGSNSFHWKDAYLASTGFLRFGSTNRIGYTDNLGPTFTDSANGGLKLSFDLQNFNGNRTVIWPDAGGTVTLGGNSFTGLGDIVKNSDATFVMFDVQTSINDGNGSKVFTFSDTPTAVNWFNMVNSATGQGLEIQAAGGDTDINLLLTPKGAGNVGIGTTTPYAKLTVGGDIALTGGLYDNTGTRGSSGQILQSTGTGLTWIATSTLGIVTDHGALTGLTDDDHTQYALLAGRSGGQTLTGGTDASNNLVLQSTTNGTKGKVCFEGTVTDGTTFCLRAVNSSGTGEMLVLSGNGSNVGNVHVGQLKIGNGSNVFGLFDASNKRLNLSSDFQFGWVNSTNNVIDNSRDIGLARSSAGVLRITDGGSGGGALYANYYNATSTTATSTFAGGFAIETTGFVYDYSSNNVGIGTVPSTNILSVNGSIDQGTNGNLYQGYGRKISWSSTGQAYNPSSAIGAESGDIMKITGSGGVIINEGSGNVGIGTSSPYAKLSIAGTLALTGGLYDNNATLGTNGAVLQSTGTGLAWVATSTLGLSGVTDHGALTGLTDDDHTQYALLAGRSGGQTLTGGTGASQNLLLRSTSNSTKGLIQIEGTTSASVGLKLANTSLQVRFADDSGWAPLYSSYIRVAHPTSGSNEEIIIEPGNHYISIFGNGSIPSYRFSGAANAENAHDTMMSRFGAGVISIDTTTAGNALGTLVAKSIGVGSTSPQASLVVKGSAGTANVLEVSSSTDASILTITGTGYVGIGTSSPASALSVNGNISWTGFPVDETTPAGAVCLESFTTGKLMIAQSTDCFGNLISSSLRFKHDINDLGDGLDLVKALRPVSFVYNGQTVTRFGFVAEEVEGLEPRLVTHEADGRVHGLNYNDFIAVLVNAIKELNDKLTSLTDRFTAAVVTFKDIIADRMTTKELCLEEVCITKDELQELLDNANQAPHSGGGADEEPPVDQGDGEDVPPADEPPADEPPADEESPSEEPPADEEPAADEPIVDEPEDDSAGSVEEPPADEPAETPSEEPVAEEGA